MKIKKHVRMELTWQHILHARALMRKSNPASNSYLVDTDKVAGRSARVLNRLAKLDILHRQSALSTDSKGQ